MGVDQLKRFRVEGDEEAVGFSPDITFVEETKRALCFDQSLSSTGWALVDLHDRKLHVVKVGMVKTSPMAKGGFEDSLQRGAHMFLEFAMLIEDCAPDIVVHEMPAARQRASKKKEAGPIAASAVRHATILHQLPVRMLNAQQVKMRLAGSSRAEKADVRRGVEQVLGTGFKDGLSYYNNDVVDAIALGVIAFAEEA